MAIPYDFEVIIIGGSYAGMSAAMALGRSLRKVLVIDSGQPCNRQTPHSHNFLTRDGETPAAIAEQGKRGLLAYPTVTWLEDLATGTQPHDLGFTVSTRSGKSITARKLVFATGITDLFPAIGGFEACWGISVIHCPYCHGYEVRGERTGLLLNGDAAMHMAPLVRNLTNQLTIFTSEPASFKPEQRDKLERNGIPVVETPVKQLIHDKGYLREIVLEDGAVHQLTALYAPRPFRQHSDLPAALGCQLGETGFIDVDAMQQTTIPGIYACGDSTIRMRSVAGAVATGNLAGAAANMALSHEAF